MQISSQLWGHLKGPLAELVVAAASLVVRGVLFIGFYLVVGVLSVLCCVVGTTAETLMHLCEEGFRRFCLDACHSNWGEVACVLFC